MASVNGYSCRPTLHRYLGKDSDRPDEYVWDIPIKPYILKECSLENICLSLIFSLCSGSSSIARKRILGTFLKHAENFDVSVEESAIYEYVQNFNPFFPIFKSKPKLTKEVQRFVQRTEPQPFGDNEDYFLDRLNGFLISSSNVFNCQVSSCFLDGCSLDPVGDVDKCQVFKIFVFERMHVKKKKVTFSTKRIKGDVNKYICHCIPENAGNELQKNAFHKIMRLAGIYDSDLVEKLFGLPLIKEKFFWSLLSFDGVEVDFVRELLHQPDYIVRALFQAAFTTGAVELSRIFSVVRDGVRPVNALNMTALLNFDIVFAMHNRFVSTWRETVHENLDRYCKNMQNAIEDFSKYSKEIQLKAIPLECQKVERNLLEILQYHYFQNNVHRRMCEVEKSISTDSGLSVLCSETDKLKEILKSYKKHFYTNDMNGLNETRHSFDKYQNFFNYSKILDFHATLMLFDNSFSVKRCSKNLQKIVEEIESTFLRFIFLCYSVKYCPREYDSNDDGSMTIMYIQRVLFFDKLVNSIEMLNEVLNSVHSKPKSEFSASAKTKSATSASEPETFKSFTDEVIVDELLLKRLKHYLDLSLQKNLRQDVEKMSLVVTRTFEIVGETMSFHSSTEPTLMEALLISSLPPPVLNDLKQIKLSLFHAKLGEELHGAQMRLKIDQEKKEHFPGLVADLRKMRSFLHYIYDLQIKRMEKYYIENMIEALKDSRGIVDGCTSSETNETRDDQCCTDLSKFRRQLKKVQNDIKNEVICHKEKFRRHLDSLELNARSMLQKVGNDSLEYRRNALKSIRYIFSCMKVILQFVDESCAFEIKQITGCLISVDEVINNVLNKKTVGSVQSLVETSCERIKELSSLFFGATEVSGSNASIFSNEENDFGAIHQFALFLSGDAEKKLTKEVYKFMREEKLVQELKKLKSRSFSAEENKSPEFFHNRVKLMKKYLIDEIPENVQLWRIVQDESSKIFLRDTIASIYVSDNSLQAAIETLTFDCMNMTKKNMREEWLEIREKTDSIFNGVNVRNVMSARSTLFEAISKTIDPGDLAREVASKCIEIMSDLDALEHLVKIRAENPKKFLYVEDVSKSQKDFEKTEKYLFLLPDKKYIKKTKLKKLNND